MSADYLLIRQALPQFDELQTRVAEAIAECTPRGRASPLRVLDLGCGDGITSHTILSRCLQVHITAVDSEEAMVAQATENLAGAIRDARCQVILHDALSYLRGQPASTFDAVTSALALHNMTHEYRHALHEAIFRALKPGGRFINADRYVRNDEERIQRLLRILERFFDTFVPLGKLDLLREAVLHEVADEAPDRVMREDDTLRELAAIGFRPIEVTHRCLTAAVLTAIRPSSPRCAGTNANCS
jgi:ubiquinone/menaquinone biosynthesis C-methylase UbiE